MATTARFLVLWGRPGDPAAFERHYREVHIPLALEHDRLSGRPLALENLRPPVNDEDRRATFGKRWRSRLAERTHAIRIADDLGQDGVPLDIGCSDFSLAAT